jgi:hypothetical protein
MTGPSRERGIPGGRRGPETVGEGRSVPRCVFDADLLFRCMELLGIEQRALAVDDPLLFRELQGRCCLCPSKDECVEDLAEAFDDERWVKWRMYCPNSGTLIAIDAVRNCVQATRKGDAPSS